MALMPVTEALARLLDGVGPLPAEWIAVGTAHGRVLADDLVALRTQPPADVSAMDGYAVRAPDVAAAPVTLRLVGEAAAGRMFTGSIGAGQAARILTGGVVPAGADTVVIQENTQRTGDLIEIRKGEPAGRHVRRAGLDFRAGDPGVRAGRVLTVRDLALTAAMNHAVVPVHRRPRVAVLSTGDELVAPGTPPAPGQIVSSNSLALVAMAGAQGAEAIDLGIARDDLADIRARIRRAQDWGADVLVTTGGASVGDYDLVQDALAAEGMALAFWKIAMRPGKPLMAGRLGAMRVLGLPGNPVSTYVCGLLFLGPLLRAMAGHADFQVPTERAALGAPLKANDEREDYMRARLQMSGGAVPVATPLNVQDSSMLAALGAADCLIVRAVHATAAKVGEPCAVIRLTL